MGITKPYSIGVEMICGTTLRAKFKALYFGLMPSKGPTTSQRLDALERRFTEFQHKLGFLPRKTAGVWHRKNWKFALSSAIGILTLVITYFAWWQPHHEDDLVNNIDRQITRSLKEPLGKLEQMRIDLAGIKATLDVFTDLEKERITKLSILPKSQFDRLLPAVHDAIIGANALRIAPPKDVVASLKSNLAAASVSADEYWPTVSAFVSYQSRLAHPQLDPNVLSALPQCGQPSTDAIFQADVFDYGYKCILTLDGKHIFDSIFQHAILKYDGGPTTVRNMKCVDCYLLVKLTNDPSGPAKTIAKTLFA